jgi:hypothetical protein
MQSWVALEYLIGRVSFLGLEKIPVGNWTTGFLEILVIIRDFSKRIYKFIQILEKTLN